MSLNKLPSSTITRLQSSQVISSIFSAVKELLENALDSGATSISVKLVNYGLDSIEVQDNGSGVSPSHVKFMCLPHYTSKISDFSDLGSKLATYGFRGEALSSLCNVASVNIITRTDLDEYASSFTFNNNGHVINTSPSHYGKGTTVIAQNIFSNFPVRKRYISSSSKLKAEMKKIENLVKSFAIINCKISFSFCHDKNIKWQKSQCSTLKESISSVMGYLYGSQMEEILTDQSKNRIILVLPKQGCNGIGSICLPENNAVKVFVNQRPVEYKKVEKVVIKGFHEYARCNFLSGKCPFCVVSIKVPPNCVDVNTEPNKTKLLCHNEDELIASLEKLMQSYYGFVSEQNPVKETDPLPKQDNINGKEQHHKGKKVTEKGHANVNLNFSSSSNENCDLEESFDEGMALWSRGHIANPRTGDILQGGATIVSKRLGQQESRPTSRDSAPSLKRKLNQEKSIEDNYHCMNEPSGKRDNAFFEKAAPQPAVLTKPNNNFNMSKSVESKESSIHDWDVSAELDRNDLEESRQQLPVFHKPNNFFTLIESNEGRETSVHNDKKCDDASFKKTSPQQTTFSKPSNVFIMSKTNGSRDSLVGENSLNNSARRNVSSSNYMNNSRNASPKVSSIQNNTISEMFKRSVINPKDWKQGDVQKCLKWYTPPLNCSKDKNEMKWDINLKDCVREMNMSDQVEVSSGSSQNIQLLTALPNGVWMYKSNQNIGIIRHWCIKENLLYEQYIKNCAVPIVQLEKPLVLTKSDFTPQEWQHLLALKTEIEDSDCKINIISEVILKNGFRLTWDDGDLYMTHIASSINFYGIEALKEILNTLDKSTELALSRPGKVRAFFRSEAVRFSHKRETLKREEMEKLIDRCKGENLYCHGKLVFLTLHKLS